MGMSDIIQFGSYFTFDDIVSNQFGVWISGEGTFNAPERDIEFVEIPGRSGDLILENNRFRNIEITYPAFISKGFESRFDIFKAALLSKKGYKVLQDTYHPDEFRLAAYSGPMEPQTGPYNRAGTFDIVFRCKPQRYLVSGTTTTTFTASGTITNPTNYTAQPNIRVYGAGNIAVGGVTITVAASAYPYIDIDCEAMDARYGSNNANSLVTVYNDTFPTLAPGENAVTFTGFSQVTIQPRWWTV